MSGAKPRKLPKFVRFLAAGPRGVGKSSLVEIQYWGSLEGYKSWQNSCSTLVPDYVQNFQVDGCTYAAFLGDMHAWEQESVGLTPYMLRAADVILLCFSIINRPSFTEAITTYHSKIREISESTILLVGLKLDLVEDKSVDKVGPVITFEEGIKAAINLNAFGYCQCSSHLRIGTSEVFQEGIRACTLLNKTKTTPAPAKNSGGFFSTLFNSLMTKRPKEISAPTVAQTCVEIIPDTLWSEILCFLHFVSLIRLSRTCKKFYHLCKAEPLWSNAKNGSWNIPSVSNDKLSWRNGITFAPRKVTLPDYDPPERVCFGPNATITLASGKLRPMKDLRVGDQVATGNRSANIGYVSCIWRCFTSAPVSMVVREAPLPSSQGMLEITPDHPIMVNDVWCLPTSLGVPTMMPVDCLYNIVITPTTPNNSGTLSTSNGDRNKTTNHQQTVIVGGVTCCTLGMTVPGYEDPFWGTQLIIDWLSKRPDFPNVCTQDTSRLCL
ncbi:hypothetical protein Pelo_6761 [Pelomyxa schiedti]|nr:hypothetical protein Pelo_6761 [Pelomyxa schiedti]